MILGRTVSETGTNDPNHSHRGWSHSRENLLFLVSAPRGGDFLGQIMLARHLD
jgi:hypothetical protein